jgi:hypothetical protein
MSYPEPQGPRDCVAAWAFVGIAFIALVIASFIVELAQTRPQLTTSSPSLNAVERKATPKRRADSCCGPYDEPRRAAR